MRIHRYVSACVLVSNYNMDVFGFRKIGDWIESCFKVKQLYYKI